MIVALTGLAVASAGFAAVSLRLQSLISVALAGYLALVANLALVTWALSPFSAVNRAGLLVAELVLLAAAVAVWWRRGRPSPPLAGMGGAIRELGSDPVTLFFLTLVGGALLYELLLCLAVPPNNWDSLTYHLSRAAAWKQEGGVHWIANAPTARMNEFQPLAEQQILFLFVAAGSSVLYALPQYVAQLAILVAVYGVSRQLGFDRRMAVCGAGLLATFSAFALQATTAQNDLVAASFPIVAAYFLLAGGRTDLFLAGLALSLGLGAKLTTILAWPVLLWLAWPAGRRALKPVLAGGAFGLAVGGAWGFVLNLIHTGNPLGHGQGRTENSVSVSLVTDLHTAARLLYRTLDLTRIQNTQAWALAAAGILAGAAVAVAVRRRPGARWGPVAVVALPLAAPALVLGLAPALAWATRITGIPVHDAVQGFRINRTSADDYSAFGPLGAYALIATPILSVAAHRGDRRRLALGLAVPVFVLLLGLYAAYNIWLTRFLLVPVALTAPLFAWFFRGRAATVAITVVAAFTLAFVLGRDASKPAFGPRVALPWQLTQAQALASSPAEPTGRNAAEALLAYRRLVPADACIGAVLDPDEWSFPLWGPRLEHRVLFLPSVTALQTAVHDELTYVVVSTGRNAPVADQFTAAGWKVQPLGTYWQLAVAPEATGACTG